MQLQRDWDDEVGIDGGDDDYDNGHDDDDDDGDNDNDENNDDDDEDDEDENENDVDEDDNDDNFGQDDYKKVHENLTLLTIHLVMMMTLMIISAKMMI